MYRRNVSTAPPRFRPGSSPSSQRIRVRIQSRLGAASRSLGEKTSPVGRRAAKTAPSGCPSPIFSLILCKPVGVRKLPASHPSPCAPVDTGYSCATRTPSPRVSRCLATSIRMHVALWLNGGAGCSMVSRRGLTFKVRGGRSGAAAEGTRSSASGRPLDRDVRPLIGRAHVVFPLQS
jgi:hypothetical protein